MEDTLKQTFKHIQDSIKLLNCDLNHGGCVVFARMVAEELEKRHIPFKVVLADYNKDELDWILSRLKIGDYYPACNHVLLKIDGLFIDSEKSTKTRKKYASVQSITMDSEDIKYWEKEGDWNDEYERAKYNSTIKGIIKSHFQVYDKIKNRM